MMMNKTHSNIASFVLRFTQDWWQNAEGQPQVRWRGHIRHVQGNKEDRFTDFAHAVTFIQRNLAEETINTVSGKNMNQEQALRESFKFWEEFSSAYSGMMFEAVEQSLQQSETVKKQMQDAVEKTLTAWQVPVVPTGSSSQTELVELLRSLQNQIETLSKRVADLEATLTQQNKS